MNIHGGREVRTPRETAERLVSLAPNDWDALLAPCACSDLALLEVIGDDDMPRRWSYHHSDTFIGNGDFIAWELAEIQERTTLPIILGLNDTGRWVVAPHGKGPFEGSTLAQAVVECLCDILEGEQK